MVSGVPEGHSSLNVMRSRRSPPTAHLRVRFYSVFKIQGPKVERSADIYTFLRIASKEMDNILTANDSVDMWLYNNFPGLPRPERRRVWAEDCTRSSPGVIVEHDDIGVEIDVERALRTGVAGAPQRNIAEPPYGRECRPIFSFRLEMPDGEASHFSRTIYQECIVRVVENIFGLIADRNQGKQYILS